MRRVTFLHTGAMNIATFDDLASVLLPGVEVQHLLDDRIVTDLRRGARPEAIADRLSALGRTAVLSGADALMFTCSSISPLAEGLGTELDLPVYRVDEAMADRAVTTGRRVSVVATLETTLQPTAILLRERASIAGREVTVDEILIDGAFDAILTGRRDEHDRRVVEAIEQAAAASDVVVLAQASMVGAAGQAEVSVPILTSPKLGVERLAEALGAP